MARNRASAERTRLRRLEYTRALEKSTNDLRKHAEHMARELAEFCAGRGSIARAQKLIRMHTQQDADNLARCKDLTDPRSVVISGPAAAPMVRRWREEGAGGRTSSSSSSRNLLVVARLYRWWRRGGRGVVAAAAAVRCDRSRLMSRHYYPPS